VENLNLEDVEIFLGDVCIVQDGGRALSYTEAAGQKVMQQEEITVRVVLKRGEVMEDILTCDFSYDYVRINAEYRT
jgi:glutamate N-acetyltransferase/amino-acid N-acetyltransferase